MPNDDARTGAPEPETANAAPSGTPAGPVGAPAQILAAAAELFHERSPSSVSLREIARRADVNYGLIHHYFGTKEAILAAVFRDANRHGAHVLADAEDTDTALRRLARDPQAYARMLAWAVLDSDDPDNLFEQAPAVRRIRELLERQATGETPRPAPGRDAFDPRVVAATSVLVVLGWSLFEPYLRAAADLADRDRADIRAEVLDLLTHLTAAPTFTPRPGG